MTPRTPLFEGKIPENPKTKISIRKGRLLLVNDQGFSQIPPTYVFKKNSQKKSPLIYPREIWLKPMSCFCSIYHNFVINEYFDLKFAVYLAIAFYYDVLKRLFYFSVVVCVVVVVSARSRLAFFRNRG